MLRALLVAACAVLGGALPMSYRHHAVKETLHEKLARTDSTLERALAKIDELAIKVDEAADDGDFVRPDGDAADLERTEFDPAFVRPDEDELDPDEVKKRHHLSNMKQKIIADAGDELRSKAVVEEKLAEMLSNEPIPGYKEGKCDGGDDGRHLFWLRGAKWNKETERYEKDLNNRLGGIVMPTFVMHGAANAVDGEPFFDEKTESGFSWRFDNFLETSGYWRTQMIMSYLHCKLGLQGTCEETTAPDCNVYYQCQCANNGLGKDYHPITNPECKKCAVMCRNNAPVGYCDKEDGCGAEHELAYMNMRLLPKGQRTLKNGEAKYLKDGETTYRVCESTSMSFLKTKRSCAKHSGPGADATCKGWCEKWYTDTHKGRAALGRSTEYGICAGYTDEDWDKVARLLVNNPSSKGKITKKDLDRGRGGEVTRLLIKQDE